MNSPSEHISLSTLNSLVAEAITTHLAPSYWVVAELVEVRENYSGHCYLTLAEKANDKVLAQSKAAIWQKTYRMVKPYFESSTGQSFAAGIKVRIKVSVSFHNVYGLNMTVQDIDPAYTVGEVTLRRQQILRQLEEDGVSEMNRELEMPELPQRIAIISSPTAAGYEDFINQLEHNSYGYKFYTRLFAATMQGEGAEVSIIAAMEQIFENVDKFDTLVIIRGGGAAIDLSC
nr:exodeoxyribonuclease VII large subunit [Bacteroidales bacterium]